MNCVKEAIEEAIVRKAKSVLREQRIKASTKLKHAERFHKRTGVLAGKPVLQEPRWWQFHPHFNPRYCITHAKFLARVLWQKLQEGSYQPTPAVQFDIEKPDGSTRPIMAFSIPDAAVANVFHRTITARNINLFSAYSYAYRPDKNVFDAILHLKRSLSHPKSYIVQYDFSKYFDTIDHNYLDKLISNKNLFLLTSAERTAIRSFLIHRYAHVNDYKAGEWEQRTRGVPQGCSLSLFLSNAAAHELDLALERQNGTFVRFADDVVAITHTYTDARNVALQFRAHCKVAGIRINFDKSPGILLFNNGVERDKRTFFIDGDDGGDIETIDGFEYLGHRLCDSGITISTRARKRIKRKISEIIHKHLFLYRRGEAGALNRERVGEGFYDWDLVTRLNEIRRYLYGGLRETQISDFLVNKGKLPFVRGLMAFYPLVTDPKPLMELDGWLENALVRATRERCRVLRQFGIEQPPLTREQIRSGSWYNYEEVFNDSRLPSFVRAWRSARKYYLRYGLRNIEPPSYYSLLSFY